MIFGGAAKVLGESKEERGTFFRTLANTTEVRKRTPMGFRDPVRMSSLPYFCAREEAIRIAVGELSVEEVGWPKRWVMNRGTGIHHALQNEVLPLVGAIDGLWRCQWCGAMEEKGRDELGYMGQPTECSSCHSRHEFVYQEVDLHDDELLLTGHVDGLWLKHKAMWEFKTCGEGTYRRVLDKGPSVAHRVQAGGYLRMLNSHFAGDLELDKAFFLYVPMEDVSAVRIPPPDERPVPYEVDPDTRMIFYPLGESGLKGYFEEAYKRVQTFRQWRYDLGSVVGTIPARHPSCTCAGNAGQWKWGCDFAEGCIRLGDRYEEKT